jgi:SAM-dependent methyltransferase
VSETTATGYLTDVAYIPGFYPNLAPVAIRHAAVLNRIAPPPPACRYLELGCGLGRTLTTLAAANPDGTFVGVDLNPEHTAAAAGEIAAGGLANARVITAGFGDLPADLGTFDIIAVHGVLSWVAPPVRDDILAVARRHLADGGLLLVSYNAMPGWAHLQPIRGILRQYAALRSGDSLERVRDAARYLTYLRDRQARYFVDNPAAAASVDALLGQDVRYLAHEYLNEHWTPLYFNEVASMFARAGLSFAGSLPVHTNFWDLCVRPEFQDLFSTTSDRLVTEAHKDFCANTAFRWDLYARSPRPLAALPDRLREADDLHYRLARPGTRLPYQANLGVVTSTLQGPLYQSLVEWLADGGLPLSRVLEAARARGFADEEVVRAIDAGVATDLFDLARRPLRSGSLPTPGRPVVACDLNRAILKTGALGGRAVALASRDTGTGHAIGDLEAAILLELLEDDDSADALAGRLDARLAEQGRSLLRQGEAVRDPAERRGLVEEACATFRATTLPQLVRLGIVTDR